MLRSLHWARRKDRQLHSELQEKTEERRRQHERALVESRLKKEAADTAYQLWAQNKSKSTVEPPTSCRERQELRSPRSCSSCNTSRMSSGRQSSHAKLAAPISVNMDQAKRNIECTGRSAKLHPYSNYPPRKQRRPSSKRASGRSGRSSRATNSPSPVPITSNRRGQEGDAAKPQEVAETNTIQSCEESSLDSEECEVTESKHPPSELNLGFLKTSESRVPNIETDETADDVEVQFLIGGVEEDDERDMGMEYEEDDELAFHDVGRANSINSLSLPGALTKNRTVVDVMQLLRHLGSSGSSSQHSRYARRRSFSCGLQRRFSLGAIPEGQMVTNYSNESVASLEEKSSWLRLLEPSKGSGTLEGREGEAEEKRDEQQVVGASDSKHAGVEGEGDREVRACERKTLKIVNLLWDPASSTVQTSVTESPMTPLNSSWTTVATPLPGPRSTPPHTPPSPLSSSSHHSTSSSPTPVTTPPNFKSSGTPAHRPALLRSHSSHFPASTFSSELEDLQEAESSPHLVSPPAEHSDDAPHSIDQPSLPSHSLFGGLMGGIASKSMVSLDQAAHSSSPHETDHLVSAQVLLPQRRTKSAPNILDFEQNRHISNLENSTFEQ